MRFRARIPRLVTSTVEAEPVSDKPVLDGHLPQVPNVWRIPANTVALCGRPAVWVALDVTIPGFSLGPVRVRPRRIRWEQDFGGHLYLIVVGDNPADAYLLEGGPYDPGTGALAPFAYPEEEFFVRGMIDFDPVRVEAPNGLTPAEFADLLFAAHRAYDGNQWYTAIEIPFLRVGRDSNSYAIGLLLASGVDERDIPKPYRARRFEWSGYPGAEDPVHRANFGAYLGELHRLSDGSAVASSHDENGDVLFVAVAGEAHGIAVLPDGTRAPLDRFGRTVLAAREAATHGLPVKHTPPPEHIATRVRFPKAPEPGGANITLIVDGVSTPLLAGQTFAGTIVGRNDALGIASLKTRDGRLVHLPLIELGLELRDPKRVDAALRVGAELTVGLHRDRHPRLHVRGSFNLGRSAAQLPRDARVAAAVAVVCGVLGLVAYRLVRE